ncbi:MAG: leucine-rich repeat domain-containing protein [candidate division Zixibacteria bacterium]|nr:leucine-rich repeat domain-containing protein [candidate division Zixibacteria bacterium]
MWAGRSLLGLYALDRDGNIAYLKCENCFLRTFPEQLFLLKDLQYLFLSHNKFTSLPKEIAHLINLRRLDLSSNQLTELPREIAQLTNLTTLNLSSNQLAEIPKEISQLIDLTELDLSFNQSKEIPKEIAQLRNLTLLELSRNQLKEIPKEMSQLKDLTTLNLNNNQLTQIPKEMGQLTNLTTLYLNNNRLTQIPKEIGQLTNLKGLYLSSNELTEIPKEIAQLKNLTILNLFFNQLTEIPKEIGNLPKLEVLRIREGNYRLNIPPATIEKGTKAILRYLRELKAAGEEKQYRAKVIFAGEGAVGKSCTLDRLKGKRFDKGKYTTHGIDIGVLEYAHPREKNATMKLNTWDFGGQYIYQATHQFFLTNRSLYILCWNARKEPEQCRLDYWLRTINSLAPDSPVILVATHADERAPDINYQKYKEKFPQLIGSFAVSNKTDTGIKELAAAIQNAAAALPQMGMPAPVSWVKALEEIRKIKEHHISRAEFEKLCRDNGVGEQTIRDFACLLHDLGDVICYYDDIGLNDRVILQPEWITKAISRVFEDKGVKNSKGVLDHKILLSIWDEYNENLHPVFLRLMEKFFLTYRIQGKESSVVPQLLPFEPPAYPWPDINAVPLPQTHLTMNFTMDFVPAGLMPSYIVRTHRFSDHYNHWREGVFLTYEEHKGRAQLDAEQKQLSLEVQGITPAFFFGILRDAAEEIFREFPGLKVNRFIPCICHEIRNVREHCGHFFSLESIIRRLESNKDDAECDITYTKVPISRLLYGIHPSTNEQILTDLKGIKGQLGKQHEQLTDLLIRNFVRLFNLELSKMEADCPSLITISPKQKGVLTKANIFSTTYEVQCWCQMPGDSHPMEKGIYELTQPKVWLQKAMPILKHVIEILKFYVPLISATAKGVLPQSSWDMARIRLEGMAEIADLMPRTEESSDLIYKPDTIGRHLYHRERTLQQFGGAELRVIFELLDHLDPSHYWGGLRKTPSPEGDILWLCPKHYKIFDPGLPKLPK